MRGRESKSFIIAEIVIKDFAFFCINEKQIKKRSRMWV